MTRQLQAGMPLPALVDNLARSGWGVLAEDGMHGVRAALRALADLVHPSSGRGTATAVQLAIRMGYSHDNDARHTRRCLHALEEAGILRWRRGGVVEGRPQPGEFHIDKRRVVALIYQARRWKDAALAAIAEDVRARIAKWRLYTIRSRNHRPLSNQPDTTSSPPTLREELPAPTAAEVPPPARGSALSVAAALARSQIRPMRRASNARYG